MKIAFQLLKSALLVLILLITGAKNSSAVSTTSKGTDFWLMFNGNYPSLTPTLTIFITSSVNTSGTVSGPSFTSIPFTVTANTVTSVVVPSALSSHTSGTIDNKSIHVTSLADVSVYGLNNYPATTDAYLGLPTDVLGKDYIIASYSGLSGSGSALGIVGTVNGTTVTITPSTTAGTHSAGVAYTISLDQGSAYELTQGGTLDLTGTLVTADKPISVFGASQCANIPTNVSACDHICEMLAPTTTWGKKFGAVPLAARNNGDTWRFIASTNGTTVSINGTAQSPVINKGQFIERIIAANSIVEANQPILAEQYANGSGFDGQTGDPFMMTIPPLEQFLADYTISNVAGFVGQYINIIAPNAITGSITLDAGTIPSSSFTAIGSSGYSAARITTTTGSHHLQATQPFGVFAYGFNNYDSYGYPGGQSFAAVATVSSVTLNVNGAGTGLINTTHCYDATVLDQNNAPVAGVVVNFVITGANPGSTGFATTDASGIAHFCYAGANAGTDNITASVGSISASTSFVWTNCSLSITAPSDVMMTGYCTPLPATKVTLGTPVTTASCGVQSVTNNAPLNFPLGTTVVTYILTDVNGGTATASQNVTVTSPVNTPVSATSVVSPVYTLSGQEVQTIYLNYPGAQQSLSINATPAGGTGVYSFSWARSNCNGNNTTMTDITGANAGSYQFTPTVADVCQGNGTNDNLYYFTCTVRDDHNCASTTTKRVNVVNPFTATGDVQICHKVAVRGGSVTQAMVVPQSQVGVHLSHGDGLGNCQVFTGAKSVIPDFTMEQQVAIYPNPTNGIFVVELNAVVAQASIVVTDLTGRVLVVRDITKDELPTATLDVTNYSKGIYLVTVKDGSFQYRSKIVVQ